MPKVETAYTTHVFSFKTFPDVKDTTSNSSSSVACIQYMHKSIRIGVLRFFSIAFFKRLFGDIVGGNKGRGGNDTNYGLLPCSGKRSIKRHLFKDTCLDTSLNSKTVQDPCFFFISSLWNDHIPRA